MCRVTILRFKVIEIADFKNIFTHHLYKACIRIHFIFYVSLQNCTYNITIKLLIFCLSICLYHARYAL